MLNENPVNMFFDPEMDKKMVRDGFLVLPFLGSQEVEKFNRLYKKWHPTDPKEFYKSYFDPRADYKEEVEKEIIDTFERKMSSIFRNYNAFGGLFVVKPPLEEGHLPIHQDWSFVDEKIDWSINMWCPLEDVDASNGNLLMLKGSHQFNETIRGVGTPDIYRDHLRLIEPNMEAIPMKAGEAIFFFHGIVHGSRLNMTEKSRVSIGLTLTPTNSTHYFHYLDASDDSKELERFTTAPDFYIDYASKRGARPEGASTKDPFKFINLSEERLIEQIREVNGSVILPPKDIINSTPSLLNWVGKLKKRFSKHEL